MVDNVEIVSEALVNRFLDDGDEEQARCCKAGIHVRLVGEKTDEPRSSTTTEFG